MEFVKWKFECFNFDIKIEVYIGRFIVENIDEVFKDVDIVVDCLDNF